MKKKTTQKKARRNKKQKPARTSVPATPHSCHGCHCHPCVPNCIPVVPVCPPTCAACGTPMTLRFRGHDGKPFWGCQSFPGCYNTLNFSHYPYYPSPIQPFVMAEFATGINATAHQLKSLRNTEQVFAAMPHLRRLYGRALESLNDLQRATTHLL